MRLGNKRPSLARWGNPFIDLPTLYYVTHIKKTMVLLLSSKNRSNSGSLNYKELRRFAWLIMYFKIL